jgi:hypothetical protein
MPSEIPKNITLLTVTVLFLFDFFNLILYAPRVQCVRGGGSMGFWALDREATSEEKRIVYKENMWITYLN